MRLGLFILVLTVFAIPSFAQVTTKNRVYIHKQSGLRNGPCRLNNALLNKAQIEKVRKDPACTNARIPEDIDFEKQSLITYEMRGDCRIYGSARISLDPEFKLYTVHLSNFQGGCRSGGTYSGWLLIDKIPDGFRVEFFEMNYEGQLAPLLRIQPSVIETVDASEADLGGCVWLGLNEQKMLLSEKEYLAAIRQDAQTESCESALSGLEFTKYAYIGVSINSGHCRRPPGLSFRVEEYGGSKTYTVQIQYTSPGETCRALSKYDLWIRVPQTEAKYSIVRKHPQWID